MTEILLVIGSVTLCLALSGLCLGLLAVAEITEEEDHGKD